MDIQSPQKEKNHYKKKADQFVFDTYRRNHFIDRQWEFDWVRFMPDAGDIFEDSAGIQCYRLRAPRTRDWDKYQKRILFVTGFVDYEDLTRKTLLSGTLGTIVTNILKHTASGYKYYTGKTLSPFALSFINFNNLPHLKMDVKQRPAVCKVFAERVLQYIKHVKPTHVFIASDEAAEYIMPTHVKYIRDKRGWVHDVELNSVPVKVVTSFDWARTHTNTKNDSGDQASDLANMLGQASRHFLSILLDRHPFQADVVEPSYRYIDTIKKFDWLLETMYKSNVVAIDTETRNLNRVNNNRILMFQVAFNNRIGFLLPMWHPETPFTPEELEYIVDKLRQFFMTPVPYDEENPKYLLFQNAPFDLIQIRRDFRIPIIERCIYDVRAGIHLLDENVKGYLSFGGGGVGRGDLKSIMFHYGSDFFNELNGFTKDDRENVETTSLENENFRRYCAADVTMLHAIHDAQLDEAYFLSFGESGNYGEQFLKFMLCQQGVNISVQSHMEEIGTYIDMEYLGSLMLPESDINTMLDATYKEFNNCEAVKQANDKLVAEINVPKRGLFGEYKPWLFDLKKPQHKELLFDQILHLPPVVVTKTGKPSYDKSFQTTYSYVPEVEHFATIQELYKLKSTYIKGMYDRINDSEDSQGTGRMYPSFGYWGVVTGRSMSSNPNFQNLPTRGKHSYIIKRMFVAKKGGLILKNDYSSHEVRCWGYESGDKTLLANFAHGRNLRSQYRKNPTPELAERVKFEGDSHRANAVAFFNMAAKDISDEIRQSVKGIVFGAIYGSSINSLAASTGRSIEEIQDVYDKFFNVYKKAKGWLDWSVEHSQKHLHTYSMLGRKRNLFAYMTGNQALIAASNRQAQNSPIQGMAADLAHTGSWVYMKEYHKTLKELGMMDDSYAKLPNQVELMVHDSTRQWVPYHLFLIAMQVLQWSATIGVRDYYETTMGLGKKFLAHLEIEMEIGASDVKMFKDDWSLPKLEENLIKTLTWQKENTDNSLDIDKTMGIIMKPWEDKAVKAYLDKHYPFFAEVKSRKE